MAGRESLETSSRIERKMIRSLLSDPELFRPYDIHVSHPEKDEECEAVSVEVMRQRDAWTCENVTSSRELMYRAGRGIFENSAWAAPVGIICGSGNNAGDGFVVAEFLKKAGIECEIVLISERFSEDGLFYFERCRKLGIPVRKYVSGNAENREDGLGLCEAEPGNVSVFTKYASILDCLFGTGFHGDVKAPYDSVIREINRSYAYVVSADINSGLNGDTGDGSLFVISNLTVSIGSFKTGHFTGRADEAMKDKINIDIGIIME